METITQGEVTIMIVGVKNEQYDYESNGDKGKE